MHGGKTAPYGERHGDTTKTWASTHGNGGTVETVCTEAKRPRTENNTEIPQGKWLNGGKMPGYGENVSTEGKSPDTENGTEIARKSGLATAKMAERRKTYARRKKARIRGKRNHGGKKPGYGERH